MDRKEANKAYNKMLSDVLDRMARSGWETQEDMDNYINEASVYGSAMRQWTSDGKMRHVPRPEWVPPAPTKNDS